MKQYTTEDLRNIGLFGHGSSGKTTLSEAILYSAKIIDRMGKVENGNTVSDFEPEEIKRGISLNLSLLPLEWKGKKINLVDTPGYGDFIGEVISAFLAVDSIVLVIDAISGIQVQHEKIWNMSQEIGLPTAFIINKLDRENSDFFEVLKILQERFGNKVLPILIPLGKEANFQGVVDLLNKKAYLYPDDKGDPKEIEIPSELNSLVDKWRQNLIESIIESDEELLQRYLEGEEIEGSIIVKTLKKVFIDREIFPVFGVSSLKNIGVSKFLDYVVEFFPNPKERNSIKVEDIKTGEEKEIKIGENNHILTFVFKTSADPFVGKLNYLRILSGSLRPDSILYNVNKETQEKIAQIYYQRGKIQEQTIEVVAGDLCVVSKLKETSTNDTLADKDYLLKIKPLDFPEPVFSVSVIPKTRADEDRMS
ncbi:MAG: GTP-binding protein, partial [Dictyoglomaceae bacterium]|nr:GTP-binding protein [Dictyoglomaceae bacterium]